MSKFSCGSSKTGLKRRVWLALMNNATVTAKIFVSAGSNEVPGLDMAHKYDELCYHGFRCGQCHNSSEACRDLDCSA